MCVGRREEKSNFSNNFKALIKPYLKQACPDLPGGVFCHLQLKGAGLCSG